MGKKGIIKKKRAEIKRNIKSLASGTLLSEIHSREREQRGVGGRGTDSGRRYGDDLNVTPK